MRGTAARSGVSASQRRMTPRFLEKGAFMVSLFEEEMWGRGQLGNQGVREGGSEG